MEEVKATCRLRDIDARKIGEIIFDTNLSHPPLVIFPEVILETQFYQPNRDKGKFYNEIMTSIGLDNLITSLEDRCSEDTSTYNQELGSQLATTPIRTSVANLMALGGRSLDNLGHRLMLGCAN